MAQLANALGVQLVRAEAAKGARVRNPDTIDQTMRGFAILSRWPAQKDKNVEARSLFHQALNIDPNDADALAADAYASDLEYSNLLRSWTRFPSGRPRTEMISPN